MMMTLSMNRVPGRHRCGRLYAALTALPLLAACAASPPVERVPAQATADEVPAIYSVLIAEMAAQRDDYATALDIYLGLLVDHSDPKLAERATHLAIFARDDYNALRTARIWSERAPDNHRIGRIIGSLELREGNVEAGTAQLARFVDGSANRVEAFGLVATILVRLPDKEIARAAAHRLAERYPDVAEAYHLLSQIARHSGEMQVAATAMGRAVTLRPEWAEARIAHAQLLVAIDQPEAAEATLVAGVDLDASGRDVRLAYARHLLGDGRLREALGQFERLVGDHPDDTDLRYTLALLTLETGDQDVAERYLIELEAEGVRVGEGRYLLGRIAMQRDDLEAALDWFERVDEGEYLQEAKLQRIVVIARQGRLDDALTELKTLRDAQPDQVERFWLLEAELLAEAGRDAEAMDVYDRALDALPESEDLRYARAMLAERMDQLDLLERDLRELIARNPESASALNALGYTLADRTQRYDEALELIRRALELKPDDAAVIDSMGWVQYRLGHLELALNYLRDAAARDADPEIMAHLAEVLWQSGEREQARRVLEKALLADPDDETLRRVAEWMLQ